MENEKFNSRREMVSAKTEKPLSCRAGQQNADGKHEYVFLKGKTWDLIAESLGGNS